MAVNLDATAPDPKIEQLSELIGLYKASLKWYWRTLAFTVTAASIVSAVYQVLNYYHS